MRKLLVIADDSAEAETALKYAALRARNTGATVVVLSVIQPTRFEHWAAVRDEVAREARSSAENRLSHFVSLSESLAEHTPEGHIEEGDLKTALEATIAKDPEIKILILAAGVDRKAGPGPLVSALNKDGLFQDRALPVLIVPGNASEDDIKALAN